MLQQAVTLALAIESPPERVFDFIADAANWPQWAICPCQAVRPLPDGCWQLDDQSGKGKLSIDADPALFKVGITIALPEDDWKIQCVVLPDDSGASTLEFVFHHPERCDEACFEDYSHLAQIRLSHLKSFLER